jgi:hypothetical protein
MELNEIKKLLEKYYDGDSSTEEDNLLMQFFRNNTVPDDLKTDQELFLHAYNQKITVPTSMGLEDKLIGIIDREAKKENKRAKTFFLYKISSIAAGIAIVVIIYLAIQTKSSNNALADSYNDPKLAYEQMKRTLLYISQNLNHGTEKLQHVSKINQGFSGLSAFSSFNSGLKDLELVSKYYNENKIEKK